MPPSLPCLSGKKAIRRLKKLGFAAVRQKGSHVVMRKGTQGCVVPNRKELKTGTLSGIWKQANVTVAEFLQA